MKVVQRTVSYAPGGRPLRDVNAKTKVIARAKIYSIPAGKIEIKATVSPNFSKTMVASKTPKKNPKVI